MQTDELPQAEPAAPPVASNDWRPYVIPFALFMIVTAVVEPQLKAQYVWVYAAKVVLVTGALIFFRRPWRDIRFDPKMLALGTVAGLALCAIWVLGEKFIPYPHPSFLGSRAEFNPFHEIPDAAQRGLFIATRLFGMAVMVAAMEEIFWRSFLLRYLTRPEFESLPVGGFQWGAAAIMAAFFAVAHPEWLSAAVFAFAMAAILKQTRSLFACIVAHGVTNLALGVYVLTTGDWKFW
jgi:CAAX prenyl protease-like protein